jgi:hypothetical protein
LTNVRGSSHLDQGSIDKINSELSNFFRINAQCWRRDDIERRIDTHANIKWSYPEILRATDVLQALFEGSVGPEAARRTDALRTYMAYQARYEAQVKFKQIDLQRSIIDLFVDVPARVASIPGQGPMHSRGRAVSMHWLGSAASRLKPEPGTLILEPADDDGSLETMGVLELLISNDFASACPKVVIEGAPGQGKSTVTQYLCQLHRLLLLGRKDELARAERRHRSIEARIPFRVDFRDYATWIRGRDPFSDDPSARLPAGSNPLLESFLVEQIHRYTGVDFTVSDLKFVTRHSQVLIVLDGFDEVADVSARNRIVAEISDAAVRIGEDALSAQIIITSRPAAFANSPGFPRDDWQHIQILALSTSGINAYAEKWLDARSADARERATVLGVLRDKFGQSHIRDLARNPMQLAILLALISVQGASLPDKRTSLYDKYIDIFMNRESEKSVIVRDHRDLLINIHRYLAWVLQVDSEINTGSGNIGEAKLRDTVRDFLERAGHPTTLGDQLFSGMVERVVALVSRLQGTFEFEVQPLREYFCARYLYDTAPYSPPGAQRRGALPERFHAIARNFYWLNVARFYAGCYSGGELASLLTGIEELIGSEQFKYISHVPQLAFMLIADYVFSQQPRLSARLAGNIFNSNIFRIFMANQAGEGSQSGLSIPPGPAQIAFIEKCKALLTSENQADTHRIITILLVRNCSRGEIAATWEELRPRMSSVGKWLHVGGLLGVFDYITEEKYKQVEELDPRRAALELGHRERFDLLDASPGRWKPVLDDVLDGGGYRGRFRTERELPNNVAILSILSTIFVDLCYIDIRKIQEDFLGV